MANVKLEPTRSKRIDHLEYSVHVCPPSMRKEVIRVFPQRKFEDTEEVLIIPTFQKSSVELIRWGDEQAKEKDRLLEQFIGWARVICQAIWDCGYWADATDPSSGQPYFGDGGSDIYSDVHGNMVLLRYPTENIGGCEVMAHPEWKYSCYPATMFTTAPLETVLEVLRKVNMPSAE